MPLLSSIVKSVLRLVVEGLSELPVDPGILGRMETTECQKQQIICDVGAISLNPAQCQVTVNDISEHN